MEPKASKRALWFVLAASGVCVAVALVLARRPIGQTPHAGSESVPREAETALIQLAPSAPQRVQERLEATDSPIDDERDWLAALLAEMRSIAERPNFHEEAWAIIGKAADLVNADIPQPAERLAAIAMGDEGDVDRVRSACLVALALAGSTRAEAVADVFLASDHPELERGGWIALGLLARGDPGMSVALGGFRGPADLLTFPATLTKEASPQVLERAVHRVQLAVPADMMQVSAEPGGNMPRLEEQFTRSVIVLCVLGPSAGHPGPARDSLLRWLRGAAPIAWLADDAVLHCLSLAARGDKELALALIDIAAANLFDPKGTAILEAVVRLGGQERLVLGHLRGFFASEQAIAGDPLHALTQVQAVAALMPLLASEDARVRDEAAQLVTERLANPELDATERLLFLTTLAEQRTDLVLDVVASLVPEGSGDEIIEHAVLFLDTVPVEQRPASQMLLFSLLNRDGVGSTTRVAILREIAQLGADGWVELMESARAGERDPAVLAFIDSVTKDGDR